MNRQRRRSERVKGVANILFGGTGFFIHVEPGGWLYKDTHVRMQTTAQRFTTGLMGGFSLFMNRFTGPGKIALQSMYMHLHAGR